MNELLNGRLDGVEKALDVLVASITSYKPSIQAATDLLAADDRLTSTIQHLARHQNNYKRIQHLRAEIVSLNHVDRSSLAQLAKVREEILSLPLQAVQDGPGTSKVKYTDLLDYALKIARYTVPPKLPDGIPQSLTNDIVDESAKSPTAAADRDDTQSAGIQNSGTQNVQLGFGVKQLQDAEVQWLHPEKFIPFVPWPTEEIIQRGALAAVERGDMPDAEPPPGQKPEENMNGSAQSALHQVDASEEGKKAMDVGAQQPPIRREAEADKPKVFRGLDLYDPDVEM